MKLQFITEIATPYGNAEEWIDTMNENTPVFIIDRSTATKRVKLNSRYDYVTRQTIDNDFHNFLIMDSEEFSALLCGDYDNGIEYPQSISNLTDLCKWINRNS